MKVHVCGIDIGKTVFHLVGLSKEGHIARAWCTSRSFERASVFTYPEELEAIRNPQHNAPNPRVVSKPGLCRIAGEG